MKIKLAVFGTKTMIERIQQLTTHEDEIEILPFIYSQVEETVELLDTVYNCDIYVFTEYLSYQFVKDTVQKRRLPTIKVELEPYTIATALYRIQTKLDPPPQRIALDVFEKEYLEEIVEELGFEKGSVHHYLHDPWEEPNLNKLLSYYMTLWNEKEVDYILTSTEEITLELQKREIPARTITIPDRQLTKIIDQAKALVQLSESENKQIVIGYASINDMDGNPAMNEDSLAISDKLKQILTEFATKTDAVFEETVNHQFIIYGSDKLLKHLKEHYRSFPLLQEMKSNINLPIYLGFGLGLHALESAKNAIIALDSCKHSKHSICYIVNEREEMIGPIGVKKEIDTSSLYRALIHDARLNNELSYNFIDFITERNNEPFSTNDVAVFYQVTKRSAERTVNKLLTGDVIKVAGEERPYKKGRPRKLFTLNQ